MNIRVCLVRTESSGNIGSVARAMANMGAERLILIDPKCRISNQSRKMAAEAQDILKDSIRYKNWDEFYKSEGDGIRIALTRRAGRRRRVTDLNETLKGLKRRKTLKPGQPIYLILGPEKNGLDVSDLGFVNFCCALPIHGEVGSLNLSHAALLSLYLTREVFPGTKVPIRIKGYEAEPIRPMYFPDEKIRDWLTSMGFDINARKSSAYLTLKKLFLQNCPTEHELHVLEAVLNQNIRKIKNSALLAAKDLTNNV
jgi:tRNA/rRNA methyltransferase